MPGARRRRPTRTSGPTVAIAGAGFMATVHGLAAQTLGLPVRAVAGRSAERTAERAAQLGAEVCTTAEVATRADLVVIATPPATHAELALAALTAGAGALVEKPLCTTLADADRLVEAALTRPQLAYAENLAFAPVVVRALEAAATLGPLHHVEVRAVQARPHWGDFLTPEWGGGALFDLGAHPLALALLLAGRDQPVSVVARLQGGTDHGTDEHGEALVTFGSGLAARVVASWAADTPLWDLQAASAAGVVRAELLPAPALEVNGEPVALPDTRTEPAALEQYGYLGQLQLVAADLAAGRAAWPDAAFGRQVLELACAAYASAAQGGRPVALPFVGPRQLTPLQLWRGVA